MFETELKYFIDHQDELVKKFNGQYLVLKGTEVVGHFETALNAFLDASKKFTAGTFMIQPCFAGPDAYTVTVASSFAR